MIKANGKKIICGMIKNNIYMNQRIISDPKDLKRCSHCVMPETQESISFNKDDVCSTCGQIEVKHKVDWEARDKKFRELLAQYKGKGNYDCIVPFSGGKDSTFTVWKLVVDYGMKPLVVRFNHHLLRPKVLENAEKTIKRLGVGFLDFRADWQLIKRELDWVGDEVEGVPPEYNYEKIEDMMQGVQDYLKFIKRGYGRMSHLASIDIRNGRMKRDEAMELIQK